MVGGYELFGANAFIEKTFTNLSEHLFVRLSFFVMKIGNWNNSNLIIKADSKTIKTLNFKQSEDSSAYKICGNTTYNEALRRVDVYFAHSNHSLTITITSDLIKDALESSWGIYDLTVSIFLCHSSCKTCYAINDPTQCLSCYPGDFLNSETNSGKCEKCDSSCKTCSKTAKSCDSCNNGTFLLKTVNSCLNSCPNKFFEDADNNICRDCNDSCELCTSSGCTKCVEYYYLLEPPGPTICSTDCLAGTYKNDEIRECSDCDASCKTCYKEKTNCQTCYNGTYLQSNSNKTTNSCLNSCPTHTFKDITNNVCQNCDAFCEECENQERNGCIKCSSPYFLLTPPGSSICSMQCADGTYKNESVNECSKCHMSCKTCNNAKTCESCHDSSFLMLNYCLNACPNHYYTNNYSNICEICDSSCEECAGITALNCTKCPQNFVLYNVSQKNYGKCMIEMFPRIQTTANPLFYLLIFTKSYAEIYKSFINNTRLSIFGLKGSQYDYHIYQSTQDIEIFILQILNLNFSVTFFPKMIIELNPPDFPIENSLFVLKKNSLETFFQYYYVPTDIIKKTANATKALSDTLTSTFIAYNLFSFKAGTIFQEMLGFASIGLLRFFQLNYPENFVYNFRPLTDNLEYLEGENYQKYGQLPENFQFYHISSFIWNNIGDIFLKFSIYFGISIVTLCISHNERIMNCHEIIKKIINLGITMLVWSFPMCFYFSKSMEIYFYILLIFRFFDRLKGFYNIITATILVITNFFLIIFLILKMKKLFKLEMKKTEVIVQINNNLLKKQSQNDSVLNNQKNELIHQKKHSNYEKNIDLTSRLPIILKKNNNLNKEKEEINEIHDKNRFGFLISDFKKENIYQISFMIWILSKYALYVFVLCIFFDQPFEGLIIEITLSILFIISLLIIRPYRENKNLFFFLINELILLCALIFTFLLALEEKKEIRDDEFKNKMGWGVIISNYALIGNCLLKKILFAFVLISQNKERICAVVKKIMEFGKRRKKNVQNLRI